jgi:hypothetical protein
MQIRCHKQQKKLFLLLQASTPLFSHLLRHTPCLWVLFLSQVMQCYFHSRHLNHTHKSEQVWAMHVDIFVSHRTIQHICELNVYSCDVLRMAIGVPKRTCWWTRAATWLKQVLAKPSSSLSGLKDELSSYLPPSWLNRSSGHRLDDFGPSTQDFHVQKAKIRGIIFCVSGALRNWEFQSM